MVKSFQRLIAAQVADAALLRYDSRQFIPLAIDGLAKDVLGDGAGGHPRLERQAIIGCGRGPDSELPDPYDGLIPGQEIEGSRLRWFAVVCRAKPDRCLDARRDAARSVRCFQRRRATADCRTGGETGLSNWPKAASDATPFEAVKQTQMIGLSPGMTQLKKEIEIVAASDLNVLISGETGTGKELVAKAIPQR